MSNNLLIYGGSFGGFLQRESLMWTSLAGSLIEVKGKEWYSLRFHVYALKNIVIPNESNRPRLL